MRRDPIRSIPELLRALAVHDDDALRDTAARNPALPAELIETLANDPVWHVRLSAAGNPACSEATSVRVLEAAAASSDDNERFGVTINARCPAALLRRLATSEDWLARQHVGFHDNAPEDVLTTLLDDDESAVRQTAARHARVPMTVVDAPADAREAAAFSEKAPPEVLIALAGDETESVHAKVARNPRAPAEALARIAKERGRLIRLIVLENPNCPIEVHRTWGADPHRYVYALAACPNGDPDVFWRLYDYEYVRDELARNRSCPPDLLEKLAEGGMMVRQAVAANPHTPVEVLRRLARSQTLKHFVATNSSCPPDLLAKLAESKDVVVLRGVAVNPHVPVRFIPRLVKAGMWRLLEHPQCPPEAFDVPAEDERHRSCLARHTPRRDQIAELAEDEEARVRQGAAQNPRCPVDVLLTLACDRNDHVSHAARTALSQLDPSQAERLRGPTLVPDMPAFDPEQLPPFPDPSPLDPALRNTLCVIENQAELAEALGHNGRHGFIELYVSAREDVRDLEQTTTIDGAMLDIVFHDATEALRDGTLQIAGVLLFESVCADALLEELRKYPEASAFELAATRYEYTAPLVCDGDGRLFVVTPDAIQPLGLRWGQLELSPR